MFVHWYLAEHFLELSYRLFSESKGRILKELRVFFKDKGSSLGFAPNSSKFKRVNPLLTYLERENGNELI